MTRNSVQFQKGLSEPEFERQFGTEAACREALFRSVRVKVVAALAS